MEVKSGQALLEVLSFAASQRISCSTLKNTDSSRSHAFYRLIMKPISSARLPASWIVTCEASYFVQRQDGDHNGMPAACSSRKTSMP